MRYLIILASFFIHIITYAQIAPECIGITPSADYDEEKQRAFMHNFFTSIFLPRPVISTLPADTGRGYIGIDTSYIPKLTCQQRLAFGGDKTENTNLFPVLPRLRVETNIFKTNNFALSNNILIVPPISIVGAQAWHLATDMMFTYQLGLLGLSARAFMSLGYIRAEIALPLKAGDPTKPEWFNFALLGADLSPSLRIELTENHVLIPHISGGFAWAKSIVVIGDHMFAVPNEKYPLFAPTLHAGITYRGWDKFLVNLSFGGVYKAAITAHLALAYAF